MHIRPVSLLKYYIFSCLFFVCAHSIAQFEDRAAAPANEFSQNKVAQLSLQPVTFLPVEQAYQLDVKLVDANTLQLNWDIADGYYLYQKQLKVVLAPSGQQLSLQLPEGVAKYDEYFEEHLQVYYHNLQLQVDVPAAASGQAQQLDVHSQGCADAGLCYPPQRQRIQLQDGRAELVPAATDPKVKPTPLPAAGGQAGSGAQWLLSIAGALLGGMLLNLMPCVFPVLSLKALSLANGHFQPHRQHLHGWAYTLGSVLFFVAIAALMIGLREAGYAIGWGFQLQSPLVVAALAYVFFSMALLFSGNYAIGAGVSGLGQGLAQGHSLHSSFFTGALACVVASPCTAPFMGSALGYAVTQPTAVALSIFAALGLGMALPFLLLSYYPALNRILPRPGQWMETFKQLLAFPLYLTALWLLWVLGRQAGSDAIILAACGALIIAFALWLLQRAQDNQWLRLAGLACLLSALLPLANISSPSTQAGADTAGAWQPYTKARLQQLLASNTPVFVNLTADWCITCLANERVVLSSDAIETAFNDADIVRLKGDWTNYNSEITDLLAQHQRSGVPLYLLYSGRQGEQPQVLPQLLSKDLVSNAIARTVATKRQQVNVN